MSEETAEIYEFEGFRLNVTERFLVRPDGERLQLSEKAFETLCVLVRNGGHLVKKSELLDEVWANSFVEENNLNKCVHTLRRSLGETNGETQFIETVKKHGFRFVPDVRRVSENGAGGHNGNGFHPIESTFSPAETVPTETVADPPKAEPPRSKLPIVALVGVILLGAVALAYFLINRPAPGAVGTQSIAVLPFKPINTANRDDLYEVGLAHSLIHQLNATTGLVVRPLSAVRDYTEIGQDPIAAGREQKVSHVLSSNYQLSDGKFRITADLINVASGQIEDSYKVETTAGDAFAIQDFVAAEIGKKIVARFGTTIGTASKRGTSNEQAYRHYLQGMFLIDQRKGQEAVEHFDQAVALDPNYGLAWAGKAHAHRTIAIKNDSDTRQEYERSMAAVNRALSLDPELSDAYSALCQNKFYYEYDFAGAEVACKRALELDPNSSIAYLTYDLFLNSRGRHDEAIAAVKASIDLEPSSLFSQGMYANTLYLARRYDEAREQYIRVREMNPTRRPTYEWMIRNLDASKKYGEAFDWFVRLLILDKTDERAVERYRSIFKESGWLGVLRERERTDDGSNLLRRAGLNAQIGNKDRAFELLNQAWERRITLFVLLVHDPQFDALRDDPRYAEMVSRIKSK